MRGTLNLSAWRQTVSDCGSTPPTPQKTTTAPSSTRRLRSTSIVKSTWPGVSIRWISCLLQAQVVAAAVMVMPRSAPAAIQSIWDCAVVDLADLVDLARVVQEPLGDGRLARIDVGDDADVADAVDLGHASGPASRTVGARCGPWNRIAKMERRRQPAGRWRGRRRTARDGPRARRSRPAQGVSTSVRMIRRNSSSPTQLWSVHGTVTGSVQPSAVLTE